MRGIGPGPGLFGRDGGLRNSGWSNGLARLGYGDPATRDPALVRNRFMKALGVGRGGALDA